MHSRTFLGTFSSNFFMFIWVGYLYNIYYNRQHPGNFDKCNIPFLNMRKLSVLWGLLRIPEAVGFLTVKYAFSHFS